MKKYLIWIIIFVLLSIAYAFILVQEKKDQELQLKQKQVETVEKMKQDNVEQYPEFFLFPYESDQIYAIYTNPRELTIFTKTKVIDQKKAVNELTQYFKNNQKNFKELSELVEVRHRKFSEVGSKYIQLSIE